MKLLIYAGITAMLALGFFTGRYNLLQIPTRQDTQEEALSDFDKAIEIIKKYETLHQPKHWPLVGYGHMVLPGETFSRAKALSPDKAEELLRKDLLKNCAVFRSFGADSLLLGVLAYNIGSGTVKKSSLLKKLQEGNRDIYDSYVAFSKYRGKTHTQLKNRRMEEFEALYIKELETPGGGTSEVIEEVAAINPDESI